VGRAAIRDAATGIKQEPIGIHQPACPPFTDEILTPLTHLGQSDPSRTKPRKRVAPTTALVPPQPQAPPPHSPTTPTAWGPSFANPEVLGEPPEEDFQPDNNSPKMDSRYTGICDNKPEDPECSDPDDLGQVQFNRRAIWLGRWFALHYAAWVLEFHMRELGHYEINKETPRDSMVGPLPALYWTFHRFRLPEDEWRSLRFGSQVWYSLFQTESLLTLLKFRTGLKRFRSDVVSTLRHDAIRIFGISDIKTIDDRGVSAEVAALLDDNQFLYTKGDSREMDQYLRSECILKGGPLAYSIR